VAALLVHLQASQPQTVLEEHLALPRVRLAQVRVPLVLLQQQQVRAAL
jgi:hypothetical protein